MDESESKENKPEGKRQYSQEQYEMLKRCSEKKDITEWNNYPDEDMFLEGAKLCKFNLEGANFRGAYLKSADFALSHLEGANFDIAQIQTATFNFAFVNSKSSFIGCRVDRETDFRGVSLNTIRIKPGTKQLLEYNIRRMNWDDWYKEGPCWKRILKILFIWPFWLISDYGLKTWRIIITFLVLAFLFALIYWLCPSCVMVNNIVGDIRGFWHALYFSVVTMTTLGFGDIAANPDSWAGQTLLMVQVILGYVLLGALVTRFAVLFTAGGPAGKFADEKGQKTEDRGRKPTRSDLW